MSEKGIESIMDEKRKFPPPPEFSKKAHIKSMDEYEKIYRESIEDPQAFWANKAEKLSWFKKWDKVFEWDEKEAQFSWFKGGKINGEVSSTVGSGPE